MVSLAEHLVDNLLEVENPSICSQCKGACCKGYPGVTSPEDWGAPDVAEMQRRLVPALKSERYLIDYWWGDPSGRNKSDENMWYFVRPATQSGRTDVRLWPPDPCTFHSDKGCEHDYKDRPRQCRELKPNRNMLAPDEKDRTGCDEGYSKQQAAIDWMPYRDMLHQLYMGLWGEG